MVVTVHDGNKLAIPRPYLHLADRAGRKVVTRVDHGMKLGIDADPPNPPAKNAERWW
jgi:hypothetical protein